MKSGKLRIIAITLLLTGFILVAANFISPHSVSVPKQVLVEHFQPVTTDLHDTSVIVPPLNLTTAGYEYFSPVHLTPGQTLNVDWYADEEILGYIFSQSQFNYFQSIFPQVVSGHKNNITVNPAVAWANENGFAFEAGNFGAKLGGVSYNVTEEGDYLSIITQGIGANRTQSVLVVSFTETVVSHIYQTQNVPQSDSLYLCFGPFLIISGTTIFMAIFLYKKKFSLSKKLWHSKNNSECLAQDRV